MNHNPLGKTGLEVPPIVFGTSCLGNLYKAMAPEDKLQSISELVQHVPTPVMLDSAGKYGAGMALEVIGNGLRELSIDPESAIISNKLGWYQVPLRGAEPTFEPGAWADLTHDAEQRISYDGILACWEQGNQLLGEPYRPQLVSVHDPDEYLARPGSSAQKQQRRQDIRDAYRALFELKEAGEVRGVGIGSKDWTVIRDLAAEIEFDWVMLACSLTIMHHPPELLDFVAELFDRDIGIINSAVFHAGFLTGGAFFDYRKVDPGDAEDQPLFAWRDTFFTLCRQFEIRPAAACVQFALTPPGVISIALNTGKPERVKENVELVQTTIPTEFWRAMKDGGLIAEDYPYAG
ncbi:MAG: L-fucose dehydrogenase [Lentisphaerae bacterium RIFOXYB12_FULL_65_16]|nr:MAG: L-fucose dehydrogenase [Lentisphaerae bacterium RIFOXYA12_64_32]OGV92357.1 MAG: L-fucose dehydrogenase [Lentisphaerae bacterium RIFOXYB12_FULL_65_16]